jgi:putative transposase
MERQRIVQIANEPAYAELSPSKIVPKLADEGRYIASESSFYRVLKAQDQLQHRQRSKPVRQIKKPKALTATGPNQIYSWESLPDEVLWVHHLSTQRDQRLVLLSVFSIGYLQS